MALCSTYISFAFTCAASYVDVTVSFPRLGFPYLPIAFTQNILCLMLLHPSIIRQVKPETVFLCLPLMYATSPKNVSVSSSLALKQLNCVFISQISLRLAAHQNISRFTLKL